MREFFRSWKRKGGVVTLLIACLFMSGWIRGLLRVTDRIVVPGGKSYSVIFLNNVLASSTFGVSFHRCSPTESPSGSKLPVNFNWKVLPMADLEIGRREDTKFRASSQWIEEKHWSWECSGFVLGGFRDCAYVAIPYWAFVAPLACLSAYLLLSGPRKACKQPTTPPPVTGA